MLVASIAANESVAEEEEYDENAAIEEPIPVRAARGRDRRGNVFVEAVELEDDWVPPTYPKSDEETKRLEAYVGKTALLSYLDDKAKATVIGAFQKKSFAKDEAVITQVRTAGLGMLNFLALGFLVLNTSVSLQSKAFFFVYGLQTSFLSPHTMRVHSCPVCLVCRARMATTTTLLIRATRMCSSRKDVSFLTHQFQFMSESQAKDKFHSYRTTYARSCV